VDAVFVVEYDKLCACTGLDVGNVTRCGIWKFGLIIGGALNEALRSVQYAVVVGSQGGEEDGVVPEKVSWPSTGNAADNLHQM
jgi:hypothetical protein